MNKTHNLTTVLKYEYMRTIRQPTFWISVIAIPVMIVAVIGISYLSSKSTEDRITELSQQIQNTVVVDEAGVISPQLADQAKLRLESNKQKAIDAVKDSSLNGAIIYPQDIEQTRTVEIYTNVADTNTHGAYSKIADDLLEQSILAPVGSQERIQLVLQDVNTSITTFKNGQAQKGFAEYIVPGAFLVLFYVILVFSTNYMLTSVSEEKENRAMELILSSVRPRTLIVGKMLGLVLVTLTQIALLIITVLAIFLVAQQFMADLTLPITINELIFNPERIAFGAAFLILGFLLFSGLMAGVGAIVPSAKEAGGLTFVFIFGAIIPFYLISTLTSSADALVTKIFTFFPLTAPVTLLIRNTVGNIGTFEAILALVLLAVFTILSFWLAARLFARGALEYSNRLSLKEILK